MKIIQDFTNEIKITKATEVTARLGREDLKKLRKLAKAERRSISKQVIVMLESYLED